MKYIVLVNEDFTDAYTGQKYKAGERAEFEEVRVNEIKAVKATLISPISKVKDKPKKTKKVENEPNKTENEGE